MSEATKEEILESLERIHAMHKMIIDRIGKIEDRLTRIENPVEKIISLRNTTLFPIKGGKK